nr:MAG TPA: hypothetical protein [Caudoviricetes sp.]
MLLDNSKRLGPYLRSIPKRGGIKTYLKNTKQ